MPEHRAMGREAPGLPEAVKSLSEKYAKPPAKPGVLYRQAKLFLPRRRVNVRIVSDSYVKICCLPPVNGPSARLADSPFLFEI